MPIDAKSVADLRAQTGAGMMDAKKALEETQGDVGKAAELLRKKGIAKAETRSGRATGEGRVHSYIHSNGKLGAMVEVLCETDFVARNEKFVAFCHDIAMHVSAASPLFVSREQVPAAVLEKEKELFRAEMQGQGKPAEVMEKIVQGKMEKFFEENVLLDQPFVKDEDKTVGEYLKETNSALGENIQIGRIAKFQIGV